MKLSIEQVAGALDLPVSTVERWIRQGRIPIQKSENEYVFQTSAFKKWAASNNLPLTLEIKKKESSDPAVLDNLSPAIQRGGCYYDVTGDAIDTVLRSAVNQIAWLSESSRDDLYANLIEREKLASTGLGNGIAIPHPREPLPASFDKSAIATCFLEQPVDFNAIDDKPVFVLFILMSPSVKYHLHMLSRLSFCIRDMAFVDFLKTRPTASAFLKKVDDFEKRLDSA